ncbi:MAG: DUF4350 domain-containing protein [Gemmatimonadaceae bacterium]
MLVTIALVAARVGAAQQLPDTAFNPRIAQPSYAEGRGPVILIDEAHENFHTAGGRYLAFARLLRRDGYVVRPNTVRLTRAALEGARVLVIANALHERNRDDWDLPTPSAFTAEEVAAMREWVAGGGSLLLIADHMPFPGAVDHLAAAFGVFFIIHGKRVSHDRRRRHAPEASAHDAGAGASSGVAILASHAARGRRRNAPGCCLHPRSRPRRRFR